MILSATSSTGPVIAKTSIISSVISSAIPAMSPFAIFSCSFGGVSCQPWASKIGA
ncbi:hypothetical protein D3C83_220010 [compost metagenome]